MGGLIDFHAHILPGVDHGSKDLETSLFQLNAAAEIGIGCIIATPHFYPDSRSGNDFFIRRDKAYNELIKHYSGEVKIRIGAEVFLCEGLQNYSGLSMLCIEGTSTLLIEMPNPPWPARFEETLFAISNNGYQVILAHVDRYPMKEVLKLVDLGFTWQLNAGSVVNPLIHRKYLRFIDEYVICALGSDIHGKSNAYSYYSKAMKKLGQRGTLIQHRMQNILK